MATPTPGQAGKLNSVVGVAQTLSITAAELAGDAGTNAYLPNLMIKLPDGKIVMTDGTTAVKDLSPIIDQVLVKVEKDALALAFDSEGKYQVAAGGVVLHGADGKIDKASFDFIDENGKVKLDALPATVRAGVAYFPTYTKMDEDATDETKQGLAFVIDATDDPSGKVTKGAAMYAWIADEEDENGGAWMKVAEVESLDIDISALEPTHDNVEASGAVMYDHPVFLGGLTMTELKALQDTETPGGD